MDLAHYSYSMIRDILKFEGTEGIRYWRRFGMLMLLSVVIATMGLLRDSGAVVIAAMLIAPLMTPILGISSAMVFGRTARILRLLGIVLMTACFSVWVAWLIVHLADVPVGVKIPGEVTARTDPGTEDLIVALAAGIAAAYVQIHKTETSLLPGAAIGVSLVPPLSAAGVLLHLGEYSGAYEAILLFSTNLAAIILSAGAVYLYYGAFRSVLGKGRRLRSVSLSFLATIFALGLIVVQLATATFERYFEARAEANIVLALKEWAASASVEVVRVNVNKRRRTADLWFIVDLPFEAQKRISTVEDQLPDALKTNSLADVIRPHLEAGYAVAIRYQTRIAGLVFLDSKFVVDAPATDDISDE